MRIAACAAVTDALADAALEAHYRAYSSGPDSSGYAESDHARSSAGWPRPERGPVAIAAGRGAGGASRRAGSVFERVGQWLRYGRSAEAA